MAKIYTKTGDKGETGLIGGQRVSKDSSVIQTVGSVDELNAYIGVCHAYCEGAELKLLLQKVQSLLFDAGAELATPAESSYFKKYIHLEQITDLEQSIDEYTQKLSPLKNFILPGGSVLSAHLHYARTLCRKAERELVGYSREHTVDSDIKVFFNRLSDWLFIMARYANVLVNVSDVAWLSSR